MSNEMKLPEEIQDLFTESASLKECRDACVRIWWGAGRAAKYAFKAEKANRKAWMLVGELYPQTVNKECTYFALEGVVRFKENQ